MNKWIAEFDLEDGDTMPEHMDLNYMGAKIDFHCRPMWIPCSERLPEMGSTVLMQDTGGWMFVATYAVTPKRKYWAVLGHDYALDEAIAWMPLPERFAGR